MTATPGQPVPSSEIIFMQQLIFATGGYGLTPASVRGKNFQKSKNNSRKNFQKSKNNSCGDGADGREA